MAHKIILLLHYIINIIIIMVLLQNNATVAASWPSIPFHKGEIQIQKRYDGLHEHVMSYAPKFIRSFMPDQHREFYENLPFLVVAARDQQGRLWSTLLTDPNGQSGFVKSPSPVSLSLHTRLLPGDALTHSLGIDADLGILGIEFATKRRNRVNGRITSRSINDGVLNLDFSVDQSFGNCPQYIKPRKWWSETSPGQSQNTMDVPLQSSPHLTPSQMQSIRRAERYLLLQDTEVKGKMFALGMMLAIVVDLLVLFAC